MTKKIASIPVKNIARSKVESSPYMKATGIIIKFKSKKDMITGYRITTGQRKKIWKKLEKNERKN
jgi:hypothetical protein